MEGWFSKKSQDSCFQLFQIFGQFYYLINQTLHHKTERAVETRRVFSLEFIARRTLIAIYELSGEQRAGVKFSGVKKSND